MGGVGGRGDFQLGFASNSLPFLSLIAFVGSYISLDILIHGLNFVTKTNYQQSDILSSFSYDLSERVASHLSFAMIVKLPLVGICKTFIQHLMQILQVKVNFALFLHLPLSKEINQKP